MLDRPVRGPLGCDGRSAAAVMLAAFFVHVLVWIGGILVFSGSDRVSFEFLGDVSTPWVRQFVLPLLCVFALQYAFVSMSSAWRPVLFEDVGSPRRWLWFPVLVVVVGAPVVTVLTSGWTPAGAGYVAGVAATVVLVGVCEELAFRGYLLVSARRAFRSEFAAVVAVSVLFGFFHLPNTLLGSPLTGEFVHVAQTAVLGLLFYALRRLSGNLFVPMFVHAVWDLVVLQANWDAITSSV